jgi:mannose-6-phosphate isomerase
MAIELADIKTVPKPWGSLDLRPWSDRPRDGVAIGELWFLRADPDPALLAKLLFTTAPLSIQVHPDDAFARSIGLPRGKTESWYIVSATPDAKVALGLTRQLTTPELRSAIEDGSIADLIAWYSVKTGDFIFVPAGTIHALGAGLVVAEVQQNSDATFRMFDYGRERALDVDRAVAVARAEPFAWAPGTHWSNPHFGVQKLDIPEGSSRKLHTTRETWLLVLGGSAQVGNVFAKTGDAIYMNDISTDIVAGPGGTIALMACSGHEQIPILSDNPDRREAA